MKKISAYVIAMGSAIFLFAERVMANVVSSQAQTMQDLYGSPNVQLLYGPMQAAYGPGPYYWSSMTLYEKAIFLLRTPMFWLILVPIIFIIGLVVFFVKRRKNKRK